MTFTGAFLDVTTSFCWAGSPVVSSRQLGTLLDRAREIDHSRGLQFVPGLVILTVVFLALLRPAAKNAELYSEVHENSVRDALTGCFNRRHVLQVLDSELRRARRSHGAFALVMLDLDHFKTINDRFGHLGGDAVLAHVGQRMKAVLRGSDTKCRYGGEEFLVLLPDTPLAGARRVAEMLRKDLEQHPVRWNDQMLVVTASFGIADIAGEDTANTIMARADAALYRAKQSGRNCVRTSTAAGVRYSVASAARSLMA